MALTTGMAILGSAIVGAGAGAISSNSAAKKAANASQTATDANAALQREALATQQSNTAVARGAGDASINQLMQRLGISQNAGQGMGSSPSQPAFNAQSYLAANADVAQAVQDPNSGFSGSTPEERAADHYARYGRNEGRSVGTPAPAATTPQAPTTNDVQLSPATQVPTYERPPVPAQGTPGAQPTFTPQVYEAPVYERPQFNQTLDVSMDRFKGSPEYQAAQYEIEKQGGQVQASLAAQGLLNSGAALRRLQQVGQDNSVRYYGDFRDYNTGQFNNDRSRFDGNYNFDTSLNSQNALAYANLNNQNQQFGADYARNAYQYGQGRAENNFNVDRAYGTDLALNNRQYETGRYDNQTNALFNLANLGQGAASQYGNAVQNSANNQGNALFSNAANQGNAALTSANNLNSLIGQGTNALAYAYGNRAPATALGGASGGASGWQSWMGA